MYFKLKEHFIRRIENTPKRVYATMLSFTFLAITVMAIFLSLNIIVVTDSIGGRKMVVTKEQDPVEIMQLSGIVANANDDYYYTSYSSNIANLNIQRAFEVDIKVDNQTQAVYMTNGTVQDALEKQGVILNEHDYATPSLNTPINENDVINVHRVSYQDNVVQVDVPIEIEYKYTSLLHRWKSRSYVIDNGTAGVNELTYRQRVVDGVVESEQLVNTTQVKPMQKSVVLAYGSESVSEIKTMDGIEIINNVPSSYSSVMTGVRCSAYSSKGGRGSSGLGLYPGTIAVNPNVIPYGTKMYITSADGSFVYGYAIATDTGTALMDGIVGADLYYDTYLESVLNEIKYLNIYIL